VKPNRLQDRDKNCSIEPMGDQALLVRIRGATIEERCSRVRSLDVKLETARVHGIVETVPAFDSMAVYYRPWEARFEHLRQILFDIVNDESALPVDRPRQFTLSVCFDEQFAPDLVELAENKGMTKATFISLCLGVNFTVALIGFTPGFPYLLGLPKELSAPRRSTPRQVVAAGSVGIGGSQAGIYSLESPGGWNIIGRTPERLFNPGSDNPSKLAAGDTVRFVEVSAREYWTKKQAVDGG
jgi:inhibitor of KinA